MNGYGVGEPGRAGERGERAEVDALIGTYLEEYEVAPGLRPGGERHASLWTAPASNWGCGAF